MTSVLSEFRWFLLGLIIVLILVPTGIAAGVLAFTTPSEGYCSTVAQEARRADTVYETGTTPLTETMERRCTR